MPTFQAYPLYTKKYTQASYFSNAYCELTNYFLLTQKKSKTEWFFNSHLLFYIAIKMRTVFWFLSLVLICKMWTELFFLLKNAFSFYFKVNDYVIELDCILMYIKAVILTSSLHFKTQSFCGK